MSKNTIDTIVFDLDGTLVDTELAAAKTVQACFKVWGIEVLREDARFVAGRTWEVALEFLFKKYPPPVPMATAFDQILSSYRRTIESSLEFVEGAQDAVRNLAGKFKLGLVTGSHATEANFALSQLGVKDLFQVILAAEDYPHSKPSPDGYLKALKLLSSDPKKTLVFEDSEAGISSARSAGTWVVAITGTNHFDQSNALSHWKIPNLCPVTPDWIHALPTES